MLMENDQVDTLAKKLWDYQRLNQPLAKADAILMLGTNDMRIAEWAIQLSLRGYAPYLIFSGGVGRLTRDTFTRPEAEVFADLAQNAGVPKERIIIENRSSNTGENILLTKALLKKQGHNFQSFIIVQKPYMERRAYATFKKIWPEKDCILSSPPFEYEEYPNESTSKDEFISLMVGDVQRIKLYPEFGYQIEQNIPRDVWEAYEKLVKLGYTKHLIKAN